jgi:D-tyrosyl-tRNA(Tyr) deacylase
VRIVLQRVSQASVKVGGQTVGQIGPGLVLLVGIGHGDGEAQIRYLADKCIYLRVFEDQDGKMNRSVLDIAGEILAISQFTLYGDVRKGRRPSFIGAAPPEEAKLMYEKLVAFLRESGLKVETGRFGAHMSVEIHNDGPVTIILES